MAIEELGENNTIKNSSESTIFTTPTIDKIIIIPELSEVDLPDDSTVDNFLNDIEEQLIEEVILKEEPTTIETADVNLTDKERKQQNVIQEFILNSDVKLQSGDELTFPANYDKETRKLLEKTPNISLIDNEDSRDWATAIAKGLDLNTYGETFVSTLENPDAEFRHKIEQGGHSLIGQAPKFKAAENQNLKGERAVIRLISHLGLGTLFQVPLWHSGIWVTFKPPAESEIIELNRILNNDKILFGRYTYGLVFSNVSAYTVDRLTDFVLAHVYDITAKADGINMENLKTHISCQDIPSLLWGFVCTMYPRGFKYRRACISDPEKCNHILEDTLNISKLQWTNVNALSDWQKTFMSGRQSKNKDLASIARYKEELGQIQSKKIEINKGEDNAINIIIKTPSLGEYIDAGHNWIGDIVNTVQKALGKDSNDKDKNELITRYGQASAMRQYSHWVESIEYDTNVIDDRETIEITLDMLSSDDEVRGAFIQGVSDYINASTISVIGIPVYECPKCSEVQEINTTGEFKNILPLDVIQLFFGLLTQRLSRLTER